MDGANRQVLHSTGLVWPNGITLDYAVQRIYWADAYLNRIEFCSYDGSSRVQLVRNLRHPFAVTIEGSLIFWTDWADDSVKVTHKLFQVGQFYLRQFLRSRPYGIEAVTLSRQANGIISVVATLIADSILLIHCDQPKKLLMRESFQSSL